MTKYVTGMKLAALTADLKLRTQERKSMRRGFVLLAMSLMVCVVSCHDGNPPVIQVEKDDAEMNTAMEKGNKTLPRFIEALQAPKSGQSMFAIKKGFPTSDGDKEYIWCDQISFDGKVFHAEIGNEPVEVAGLKLGDKADVLPSEVVDWMFVENGILVGGYTVKVLHFRETPERQKELEQQMGCKIVRDDK